MNKQLSQSNLISPVFLRVALISILLAIGTGVFFSVTWIYHRVHYGLGLEIADVVMAFLAIVIFGLILVGFDAGFGAKRVLRRRKVQVLRLCRSLKMDKFVQPLWGSSVPQPEVKETTCESEAVVTPILKDRAPKRGRPPTYSIDRWIKVVSAWENRDPWHNPITLDQFLSEEFGTCADGSPRISKKTYYDWQKKVHEEVLKQQVGKKDVSAN